MSNPRVGINPLPWILDTTFHLDVPSLRRGFKAVRDRGFRAVQSDIPAGLGVAAYLELLAEFDLAPGPGYFSAELEEDDRMPATLVAAQQHAAAQAALDLDTVFIAAGFDRDRLASPAIGSPTRTDLAVVVERLGRVAAAMSAEGVIPALHPHVGTRIETEAEARLALDGVDADILGFGPDTGHLEWVKADMVKLLLDYRQRVRAVHLKDVAADAVEHAAQRGADFRTATRQLHVWIEPGRGSIDFDAVLAELAQAPNLRWYMIEVDVPNIGSAEQSTDASARWVRAQPTLNGQLTA